MSFASHSLRWKLSRVSILGALMGAVLAIAAPPPRLAAELACKCDDYGTGAYACNYSQTACVVGHEECHLTCR